MEKKLENVVWLDEMEMEEVKDKLESPEATWTVKDVDSKVGR